MSGTKLSEQNLDEIVVELLANELSMIEIAEEFGVSTGHIYNINYGKKSKIPNFHYPIRDLSTPIRCN